MTEEKKLHTASAVDLAKWHDANPATALTAEVVIRIRPDDLRCDACGKPADTLHFLDSADRVVVKFACPEHDFGDYWVDVKRFVDPDERFPTHIAEKDWGLHGLAALRDRLRDIERARMIDEGVFK